MKPLKDHWLLPDWPAPAHVRALCSTRAGGVSLPPWNSLNLGGHVGDAPAAVQANRAVLRAALGAQGHTVRPVFLRQVHGTAVLALHHDTPDERVADAATTAQAELACTVLTADCLPVLFTNRSGTRVAAVHAGWRGLASGVLEVALDTFDQPCGEVLAWLGPCIGPAAFEVGVDVRAVFCDWHGTAQAHFQPQTDGKYLANLPALTRQRLHAAGVRHLYGNDGSPVWCTVGNPLWFFSHRRDSHRFGTTGRMVSCIWLTA